MTGGSGYVGARLSSALCAGGHRVWVAGRTAVPGTGHVAADLAQPGFTANFPPQIDAVVFLAQSRLYRELPAGEADLFAVNVAAPSECLRYAVKAGANRFVLASTGSVYSPGREALDESARLGPVNAYQRSKLAAEIIAQGYGDRLRLAILRPFCIYGPGQRGMLVANLARRVQAGEEIVIDGDPGMRLSPTYIDDAIHAVLGVTTKGLHGVFNLAGPEAIDVLGLVHRLAIAAGRPALVRHTSNAGSIGYVGDGSRLRAELGLGSGTPLDAGLAAVLGSGR